MRELYRGVDKDGKWIYGGICETENGTVYITNRISDKPTFIPVDPKSVGKYLFDDKYGEKIFSGSLVECDKYDGVFEVHYSETEAQYVLSNDEEGYDITFDNVWNYDCTVVGNKYTQKTEEFVYEQD